MRTMLEQMVQLADRGPVALAHNDFVRGLARTGRPLGYRTTVVDARETFATPARFPSAHEVVVD